MTVPFNSRPLLGCEKCSRRTRHRFHARRVAYLDSPITGRPRPLGVDLMFSCGTCNARRRWGTEGPGHAGTLTLGVGPIYGLELTSAEMNADIVSVSVKRK